MSLDNNQPIPKQNFVITNKLKVNNHSHISKFNSLQNLFYNPDNYLNEEQPNIIIGKVSKKDNFHLTKDLYHSIKNKKVSSNKFMNHKSSNFNLELATEDNKRTLNRNKSMLSTQGSILFTNLNNPNTNKHSYIDFIDNNGIERLYKAIERRIKDSDDKQIFIEASSECLKTARSGFLNQKELCKLYANQEENLKLLTFTENTIDHFADLLSQNCKKEKDKLLLTVTNKFRQTKSQALYSTSLSQIKYKHQRVHGPNSTIDWQMSLRNNNKVAYKIGNFNSIHGLILQEKINDEAIAKPNISSKKTESSSLLSSKSLGFYHTLNSKSENEKYERFRLTTQNMHTQYSNRKDILPFIDYENLYLTGQSLLLIEKENAVSLKGRKIIINQIERFEKNKQEETYAIQYDESLIK